MVFFTCNHCGESVKKPAVEKHYNTKCRGAAKSVSCMDCLKDFYGEEYVAHTKCITEVQKYSGKDYVHKESKNSGAKKQESWMDIIRAILDSSDYKLSEQTRGAFQRLQSVDNVPRKKAKFQNFVKNCMHMPMRLAEDVWKVLEKEQEKMKLAKQEEKAAANTNGDGNSSQNGVKREATEENGHDEPAKKKSKKEKKAKNGNISQIELDPEENAGNDMKKSKKKVCEAMVLAETNGNNEVTRKNSKKFAAGELVAVAEPTGNNEATGKKSKKHKAEKEVGVAVDLSANDTTIEANIDYDNNFEWSAVLEKIVRKNTEGITLEKLKKRVLKKYTAKLGADELTEKQQKKFEKKFGNILKKSTAVQVEGEIVKAC